MAEYRGCQNASHSKDTDSRFGVGSVFLRWQSVLSHHGSVNPIKSALKTRFRLSTPFVYVSTLDDMHDFVCVEANGGISSCWSPD